MKIQCSYLSDGDPEIYSCSIGREKFPKNVANCKFIGKHMPGKSNADVVELTISLCDIKKIPKGLTKIFPNLELLCIQCSNLQIISKSDLDEYKNFKMLMFHFNKIEYLPGDLFEDCKKLERLSFRNNCLTFIEPNILDGLGNLNFVSFRNNPNYSSFYSSNEDDKCDSTLDEIRDDLIEEFFTADRKQAESYLRKMMQKVNDLKAANQQLRQKSKDNDIQKLKENLATAVKPQNGLFTDIKRHMQDERFKNFKIDIDGRVFYIHKMLLIARSPTFADMLLNNPEAENLKLVDIPVEIFEAILNFLYTDELPETDNIDYMRLYVTASRLQMEELIKIATNRLLSQVNSENALEVYKIGHKFGDTTLRLVAFNEIKRIYSSVEIKDEWVTDVEKIVKIVEFIKKKEEMVKAMDEEFKKIVFS